MQIGNRILRCSRLRHRVAAARLLTNRGAGTIVRAYSCELGNLRKHCRRGFIGNAPIISGRHAATHQHNRRRPRTLTLQIDLAPAADVDQAARVAAFRSGSDHHLKEVNKSYNKE